EQDLLQAAEADALRRKADLLLAHLHEIPRGAAEVTLADDFAGGAPIRITLDPAHLPQTYADKLYRRARKLSTARALIEQRRAPRARIAEPGPPPSRRSAVAVP